MSNPVSPAIIPVPSGYKVFGGTTAQWRTHDDRLKYRELGLEYTSNGNILMKAGVETPGDVGTPWSQLPYISGPQGPVGPSPEFEQNGTNIRFKNPDGTWGKWINTKGERGQKGDKGDPGDVAVDLPPATRTSLGGVSIGAGLEITPQGCLSAPPVAIANTTEAGLVKIGTGLSVSEDGNLSLSYHASTNPARYGKGDSLSYGHVRIVDSAAGDLTAANGVAISPKGVKDGIDAAKTSINATIPQAATNAPSALGTAYVGASARYAREDHVHAAPNFDVTSSLATTVFVDNPKKHPFGHAVELPAGGTWRGFVMWGGEDVSSGDFPGGTFFDSYSDSAGDHLVKVGMFIRVA